jgi:hypothetical protein
MKGSTMKEGSFSPSILFICECSEALIPLNYCFSLQHLKRNHIMPLPEMEALKAYTQTPLESSSIELNNSSLLAHASVQSFLIIFTAGAAK